MALTTRELFARLIQCEAGGESYEGQLAVGSVVMNRVRCGGYPDSISEVVYASFSEGSTTVFPLGLFTVGVYVIVWCF